MIYRQLPNGGSQYFVYDTENRLIRTEIKKPAGNTEIWEYAYDPFGRRLSKERKDKLAWTSTAPKRTHFVWDGTRLLQEYTYKGNYTYIYTDQDSYEPLAQVFDNHKDRQQYLFYFHNNQIGTPHEMTDIHGNLLWYGSYSAWGSLASEKRIYENIHQPFRLQNQYFDEETGLHYNFFRYYEAETGRFTNQDPIGLVGGTNLYQFAPNAQSWTDALGLWAFLPYVAAGLAAIGRAAISVLSKAARASKKVVNKCVGKCDKENPNSGFLGSRRFQMNQPKNPSYQPVRNLPAKIGKRKYSGHALDRMQDRGIMPSVVENTIKTGTKSPSRGASTVHYDKINKITVVTNKKSKVVTVMHGGK
ncbi:hypothetical protein AKG09_11305 [Neisseria sp. 83E34]|nr:hypothetical protein AKG09_11305 [Neisseria sp. 83E34]